MSAALLAVQAAQTVPAEGMSPTVTIVVAVILLLLSCALAITEFLIVSWGMLLVGSVVSAVAAIVMAFSVSNVAGWIFVLAVPILGIMTVRTGFRLMRRNKALILPTEVVGDAGYHHAAEAAGVRVGSVGVLVTPAVPSGRAKFSGTHGDIELDVLVHGQVLSTGDRVIVLAISGPVLEVEPAPTTTTQSSPPSNPNSPKA
ncbi:MAG: hypothetical protein AAB263_11355 [Planctomycetota bacterium]